MTEDKHNERLSSSQKAFRLVASNVAKPLSKGVAQMRKYAVSVTILLLWASAHAQVANPTSGQISAAISKGIQQAGQSQGLLLVDNARQFFEAFGEYGASRGNLKPGTQVPASGFQIRIFTPLEWIAQMASQAAGRGRTLTLENVTPEMVRPVLRVAAFPSTPPTVGLNLGLDVSAVTDVLLKDADGNNEVRPLGRAPLVNRYQRVQGLLVAFSLDDLARIRQTNPEFYIVVLGKDTSKDFKIKRKFFPQLP